MLEHLAQCKIGLRNLTTGMREAARKQLRELRYYRAQKKRLRQLSIGDWLRQIGVCSMQLSDFLDSLFRPTLFSSPPHARLRPIE
jgi:hypothetical protein